MRVLSTQLQLLRSSHYEEVANKRTSDGDLQLPSVRNAPEGASRLDPALGEGQATSHVKYF